ncbi:MAG: hypothetical protein JW791_00835 [Nanoarchaeota archaeon]|nr:hypothetical protein [Nanoarchaeota archaeon]
MTGSLKNKAKIASTLISLVAGIFFPPLLLSAGIIGTVNYMGEKLGEKTYWYKANSTYNNLLTLDNNHNAGLPADTVYLSPDEYNETFDENSLESLAYVNNNIVKVKKFEREEDKVLVAISANLTNGVTRDEILEELNVQTFKDKEKVIGKLDDLLQEYEDSSVIERNPFDNTRYKLTARSFDDKRYVFEGNNLIYLGECNDSYSSLPDAELNVLPPSTWLLKDINNTTKNHTISVLGNTPEVLVRDVTGFKKIAPADLNDGMRVLLTPNQIKARDFLIKEARNA